MIAGDQQWSRDVVGEAVTTKHELQVVLGKLHFITKCVHQGRIFVSQLFNLLSDISGDERAALSVEA